MISVIVIGKNEGERLAACLKSIQTALNALAHEVVYVDSCSTDQSLQTAKALGARCFLLAERKTTAGLGRFVGAKEARGEYLLLLDGDMQLQSGFAEKLTVRRAILCCMPVHARRAKMYYQTLFPETQLLLCPAPGTAITRENWMLEPDGIDQTLGELTRCGSQFHDILREITL